MSERAHRRTANHSGIFLTKLAQQTQPQMGRNALHCAKGIAKMRIYISRAKSVPLLQSALIQSAFVV